MIIEFEKNAYFNNYFLGVSHFRFVLIHEQREKGNFLLEKRFLRFRF